MYNNFNPVYIYIMTMHLSLLRLNFYIKLSIISLTTEKMNDDPYYIFEFKTKWISCEKELSLFASIPFIDLFIFFFDVHYFKAAFTLFCESSSAASCFHEIESMMPPKQRDPL